MASQAAIADLAANPDSQRNTSGSNMKALEETQGQTESLSNAKDRAQMTATGAMSIVQVALLREVIDSGEEGNKYYLAAIVLISISLALQIINGFINIFIANATCYYSRYQGNVMRDLSENLCCCAIRKKRPASNGKFGLKYLSSEKKAVKQKSPDEVEAGGLCGCCPCEINAEVMENYELEALHQYEDWVKQQTRLDLACRAAVLESQHLIAYMASQQLTLATIPKPTDPRAATLKASMEEARRRKKEFDTMLLSKRISDAQGEILKQKTTAIVKTRVVKMATFWQQMMNYLFYAVFVLNAFITGLVVTSSVVST